MLALFFSLPNIRNTSKLLFTRLYAVSSLEDCPRPKMTFKLDNDVKVESIDQFKSLLYEMQEVRRAIVRHLLEGKSVPNEEVNVLSRTLEILTDAHTIDYQRQMATSNDTFTVNIKDEICGLKKDLEFLTNLASVSSNDCSREEDKINWVDLGKILAPFHPISVQKFHEEQEATRKFLIDYIRSTQTEGKKPLFITDWDGTMKDYCSQYATNLQPIYSAVHMARFAKAYTRLAAVLTAGPLRGPGILDLTALPIDGPIMFSGSWGREWWFGGRRLVLDDGISDEGVVALDRLSEEMSSLLHAGDYSQFALVGSGVQRKVDRLTLGVQTVCGHVPKDLSERYQDEVRERMHRVDPCNQILVFDPSTELEVEVVVHSAGSVWNKADGVACVVDNKNETLRPPGKVLICGDTMSDLPMVKQAHSENPEGVMALFVRPTEGIREAVSNLIVDPKRYCFISTPDVFHAAVANIFASDNSINLRQTD